MAAELSTNVYWSTAIGIGETTTNTGPGLDSTVNNDNVLDGGGNRLMFTWTDTLDNGIGLTAYLSFGNLNTAGFGTVRNRNSNIGFSGDFGTIQVGANEHFSETDLIFDPSYGDFGIGDALGHITIGQTGASFTRRDSDSIWWTSNSMNGIRARAAYIMGNGGEDNLADPTGTQIGLDYTAGPLMVGISQATYEDYDETMNNDPEVTAGSTAGSEAKLTTLRASYDMGMAMVKVARWTIEQSGFENALIGNNNDASAIEADGRSICRYASWWRFIVDAII
jgi:predicted porin